MFEMMNTKRKNIQSVIEKNLKSFRNQKTELQDV